MAGARVDEAGDLVTTLHAGDRGAGGLGDPGEVAALARGKGGGPAFVQLAAADLGIADIDPCRMYAHE